MSDNVIPLNELGKIETVKVYNQAYVDKQQKRIDELEKENAELKKACDETQELLDKQIEATLKLDKENEELKAKMGSSSIDCEKAQKNGELCLGYGGDIDEPCEQCKNCIKCEGGYYQLGETEKDEHFTKAKELIKELMSFSVQLCDCRHTVDFEKTREEAEQFLNSEVEK